MVEAVVESGSAGVGAPVPLPRWQEAEQIVSWMTFIAHNCGRFADEAGCVNYALKSFPVVFSAAPAPHSDAAGKDALNGASIESAHDGWWSTCPSESAQEVETLLSLLHQRCSVGSPGEIFTDVHPQEFGAAHSLHIGTIDGQWQVFGVTSPEVNNNLFGFSDVQQEVVVSATCGQKVLPVVSLVSLGDETHQSCVVRKLNNVISVMSCCVVVCQQREEQWTEHAALRGPCAQCDAA